MRKYSTDARHDIGSLNWRDRAKERKRRAEELNDTLAAYCRFYWRVRMGDLALEPYGIRLVPNDRVVHIYEDWPGLDRRKVSGLGRSQADLAKAQRQRLSAQTRQAHERSQDPVRPQGWLEERRTVGGGIAGSIAILSPWNRSRLGG